MRKSLQIALLCLIALSANAFAEQIAVNQFTGLNNNENSTIIGPEFAQDLLNVDVTPGGKSFKKRSGYGLYQDIDVGSLHGGHHFFDSTGNDVQVWGSSVSLKGIVADAAAITLVSSATVSATWDCTDIQGSAYCVNSSRNALIKTNGATMTWYTSPLGTIVEATPDRLIVAGVAAAPSSLYVSESNNFTNFTVGNLTSSSFIEPIAAPGSKLTHLRWGCGKLLWWKDQSFGYTNFEDQFSLENRTISDTIGTFDNTSAIDPGGNVWFRGQDGHIWKYDCSGLTKESIEITPNIQSSGRRTANSWTVNSQTDFNSGSYTSTTSYSASLSGVTISTNNSNSPDNSFELNTWSTGSATSVTVNPQRTGGFGSDHCGTINPKDGTYFLQIYSNCSGGITLTVSVVDAFSGTVLVSSATPSQTQLCTWSQQTISGLSSYARRYAQIKITNNLDSAVVISSSFSLSGKDITFWRQGDSSVLNLNCAYKWIDFFNDGQNTQLSGIYFSPVRNAPNLSSWGNFTATTASDGTQGFFVRSSSNSFTILSSTPAWIAQTVGAVVAASTGTYFQVKDSFTVTTASQTPTLQSFTFNWFDGSASDQAYMHYFDNAIWTSVAFGVGVSSNTHIFRRDLISDGWTVYNFGAAGMITQNNRLYFGDVSTGGNIFVYGSGTSDNTSAINAYWRSKSFTGPDPFLESSLNQIDTFAKKDANQSLTVAYTLNTSTSPTSYTIALTSATQSAIQNRKLLPGGKTGYTFDIKYSDNTTSSAWEIFGYRIGFTQLPYRPSN